MPDDVAWQDFARRCLKPNSERLGSWTARRFARPVALRITHIVAPWGISAHHATLIALGVAIVGCAASAVGSPLGWLIGGLLLEAWYVLDHVDGQLARWRKTASLDGTALDYLMHHTVNLLIPLALAFGLARQTGDLGWLVAGCLWSWGSLILGLRHDVRHKTFIQRLKVLEGTLHVVGGGGGRPVPTSGPRRTLRGLTTWCLLKMFETHAVAHALVAVGLARIIFPEIQILAAMVALLLPAAAALPTAAFVVGRSLAKGEAEAEFAAWYRIPADSTLEFRDGRWFVETEADRTAARLESPENRSSPTS